MITLSCLVVFGWMYEMLPFDGRVKSGDSTVYAWGPFHKTPTAGRAVADGWTRYNMVGYEGRSAYPEYHDVVQTMDEIGKERGCGRALWENNEDNGQYGTTMALMLLPHWTDGCIASMEGLFFEASGTTPYHFLTAAAMSKSSSNPVRQLRYVNNDASVGVPEMADLGVRYLMVRTDEAKAQAAGNDRLQLVASSGPWDIYELAEARHRRAADGATGGRRAAFGRPARTQSRGRHELVPAAGGLGGAAGQRRARRLAAHRPVEVDMAARVGEPGDRSRNVDYVVPAEPIERRRPPGDHGVRRRDRRAVGVTSTSTRSASRCSSG